jgi:hypothetical protein
MRPLRFLRPAIAGLAVLLAGTAVAADQNRPAPEAWQKVITGQIEAFRHGNAPVAFSYASTGFQHSFGDPGMFLRALIASGYGPILLSSSHTFGSFNRAEDGSVRQIVKFIGPRHELYRAVYALEDEGGSWRVEAVILGNPVGTEI